MSVGWDDGASCLEILSPRVFQAALHRDRVAMVLADPNLPDCPIVYVNRGFSELTGYAADDALGRNCRFLQGPLSDPETVARIRRAVDGREPISERIYNYRLDGTGFWNLLYITPVFDQRGGTPYIFASQVEAGASGDTSESISQNELELRCQLTLARRVAEQADLLRRELEHRAENSLALVRSALESQARQLDDQRSRQVAHEAADRVVLLEKVHQQIRQGVSVFGTDARDYLLALIGNLQDLHNVGVDPSRQRVISMYLARDVVVAPDRVARVGMALTELITDALLHGHGAIRVRIAREPGTIVVAVSHAGSEHASHPRRIVAAHRPGLRLVADLALPGGLAVSACPPYEIIARLASGRP
jgi:PAS domain S-box-containing protein